MNIRPLKHLSPPSRQRGMSLLEVMISVLILGVGVLGIAAMQASAMRNSQSSMQQSQAVISANAMMDSMRANPGGAYTLAAMTCTAPAPGATVASKDLAAWITGMQAAISPTACGQITSAPAGTGTLWTITVQWNETADPNTPTNSIKIASRIQ